jgi:hypothetical protein
MVSILHKKDILLRIFTNEKYLKLYSGQVMPIAGTINKIALTKRSQ